MESSLQSAYPEEEPKDYPEEPAEKFCEGCPLIKSFEDRKFLYDFIGDK